MDWVLTNGSMSLFVHFFNLRERFNLNVHAVHLVRKNARVCLLLPKLHAFTVKFKLQSLSEEIYKLR